MKKFLAVAAAILLIALSVMPAFADSVQSPTAKPTGYAVHFNGAEHGSATYSYTSEIGSDGKQGIRLTAVPEAGYELARWDITGDYTATGKLTDAVLDLIASGDITATPVFRKIGSSDEPTKPSNSGKTDTSDKSPKTGEQGTFTMIVLGTSVVALAAVLFATKRRSAK